MDNSPVFKLAVALAIATKAKFLVFKQTAAKDNGAGDDLCSCGSEASIT